MELDSTVPANANPELASELVRQSLRIASLEIEVAQLHARLEHAAVCEPELAVFPQIERLLDVCSLTQELFGEAPYFEVAVDPADPDSPFVIATVNWAGDARELIELRLQWHARVRGVLPEGADKLRLSVMPS